MKRLFFILFLTFIPTSSEAGSEDRLRLVHVLLGEEGWRPTNGHPAILHVLERRRHLPKFKGLNLTQMANEYAAFLKPNPKKNDLPHRTSVYRLTLDTAPQWAVKLVNKFLENPKRVKDPCRGRAWHWGSKDDVLTSKRHRVDCGRTNNIFLGKKKILIKVHGRHTPTFSR